MGDWEGGVVILEGMLEKEGRLKIVLGLALRIV